MKGFYIMSTNSIMGLLGGLALFLYGMQMMSTGLESAAGNKMKVILEKLTANRFVGVLVGALITAIIQSSSASVGILQALSVTGAVSYGAAVPIIMGQNIGTCVTAMISSFGATKNAKRASFVHLMFNVLGTAIWLTVFCLISLIFKPLILNESASYFGIAICHTIFNVLCTVVLLPASSLLEKLAYKLVPEGKKPEKVVELDERLFATPAIAVEQSSHLASKMANEAVQGFRLSIQAIRDYTPEIAERIRKIENDTDHYEDILGTYLTKLSNHQVSDEDSAIITKLLKAIGDFERISDHAVNVLESIEEMREKGIEFSPAAKHEIDVLCAATDEILVITESAFVNNDLERAYDVEPLEQVVDNLKILLRNNHIARLRDGACTVETGFIWSDILTDFERVSDHCSNVALGIIDESEHTMNAHEVIKLLKSGNAHYSEKLAEYTGKYSI